MKLTVLSASDLARALPMPQAIDAMKEAFAELSAGRTQSPHPVIFQVPPSADSAGGTSLIKSALAPGGLGAKLVSVFPGNRDRGLPVTPGIVVLLDPATGMPTALCEGTYVTALRTGAATGAATDLLARPDARIAALFGCGGQAVFQAQAMDCVRELDEIRIFSRTRDSVEQFIAEQGPRLRARLVAADDAESAVQGADIVCCATTSQTPVFDGRQLAPGTHVSGVGSYKTSMREVDGVTVARSAVFVDSRAAAVGEAGDLVQAVAEGHTAEDQWTELGEVILGQRPGRSTTEEVTFFQIRRRGSAGRQELHVGVGESS